MLTKEIRRKEQVMLQPFAERNNAPERGVGLLEMLIVVIVGLVLTAMTAKAMFSAMDTYRVSSAGHEIASLMQLAKMKATSRDTRYRVAPYGTAYRLERYNRSSNAWESDPGSGMINLPSGVQFSTTSPISIASPPPGMGSTVTQASDVIFNSRAILVDNSGVPVDSRCFYLQGKTLRPVAVGSNLAGALTVYRLGSSGWERM